MNPYSFTTLQAAYERDLMDALQPSPSLLGLVRRVVERLGR
jgi:hypothetical protein